MVRAPKSSGVIDLVSWDSGGQGGGRNQNVTIQSVRVPFSLKLHYWSDLVTLSLCITVGVSMTLNTNTIQFYVLIWGCMAQG